MTTTQSQIDDLITQLTLTEKLAPCSSRARAAQKKPKSRRLPAHQTHPPP